ncbi:single-stranded DNA-binding protein [Streptomyces microflavus]|uniref:single-stranded DNA-binding protein n=1 Tax=Streptomyces microflavus TaxID=1919 RepID=UPI0036D05F88
MALPTLSGVARLVDDPELRFTPSGKPVADVRLAFNARRLNPTTNQWEDGDTFFVRGSAWELHAENIAESLAKGMEVMVSGELRTERWEKDGVKHERPALMIRSIGPTLAYATAKVTKAAPGQNGAQQGAQPRGQAQQGRPQQSRPTQPPADDPWAVDAAQGYSNEPPF